MRIGTIHVGLEHLRWRTYQLMIAIGLLKGMRGGRTFAQSSTEGDDRTATDAMPLAGVLGLGADWAAPMAAVDGNC
eukprot:SAG11_NODE_1867_length_4152_cov_3.687886_4_plen_76_part_00